MKRTLDFVAAATGLVLTAPLLLLAAALIRLDSRGPVLFRQIRVGRGGRPFVIYKFRSMTADPGLAITTSADRRITRVGRVLRRSKIDELPQLFNILKGDMSLVGPRPELPAYVALFEEDYRQILSVRPGLTDFASLKYRDEAALLGSAADPEREYVMKILPDKIKLARQYTEVASLRLDLLLIGKTLLLLSGKRVTV